MSIDNKHLVLLVFSNNFTGILKELDVLLELWTTCILFVSVSQN